MTQTKVFCVGFHKTGTTSLGAALEHLGHRVAGPFGVRDPDIAAHALDEAVRRAADHDAFQDNPWPLLFREMDERFPGSRFILTVRAEDDWMQSVLAHFGGVSTPMREWIYGAGTGDPVGHESVYRDRHRRHVQEVRRHFADRPEALLVMDLGAGQGWPELCGFLGVAEPDAPFPHTNRNAPARRAVNRLRGRLRRGLAQ